MILLVYMVFIYIFSVKVVFSISIDLVIRSRANVITLPSNHSFAFCWQILYNVK